MPVLPGGGLIPRTFDDDEEGEEMQSQISSVKADPT